MIFTKMNLVLQFLKSYPRDWLYNFRYVMRIFVRVKVAQTKNVVLQVMFPEYAQLQ